MSAGVPGGEDLSSNPFLTVLRQNFDKLYKFVAEKQTILLLPCASSLLGVHITQVLIETHILQATHIPGHFLNVIGQGVEIRNSCVFTSFGFKEQRVCAVVQEESLYDHGNTFKVVCIDRPLQGRFESTGTVSGRGTTSRGRNSSRSGSQGSPSAAAMSTAAAVEQTVHEWFQLDQTLQKSLSRTLRRFENTYVLVAGLEDDVAYRLQEICSEAVGRVWRQQSQQVGGAMGQHRHQLHLTMERYVYSQLHPFLWDHLTKALSDKEAIVQRKLKSLAVSRQFFDYFQIPSALRDVNLQPPADKLKELEDLASPHEKLDCIRDSCQLIHRSVEEHTKKAARGAVQSRRPVEITADDVLGLFIGALAMSGLVQVLSHAALVDLHMSQKPSESRLAESSYFFSTFHAALSFLLHTHD